ncbi:hypothetical protein OIV83_005194 [Microbotryomycetes sp. JL201]|nr:hypothetical protein OIV83_005194 [Microbotryomycetes sp. JL201]
MAATQEYKRETQSTIVETDTIVEPQDDGSTKPPGWTKTYSRLTQALPTAVSSRLPTTDEAQAHVSTLNTKFEQFSQASKTKYDELSVASRDKYGELSTASKDRYDRAKQQYRASKLNPDRMFDKAWSVTNETNIALNVSLNQVGPLHYQVLLPNETFERRVPNLWYSLELRPWTGPGTAYNSWSVTWPILAVAGPTAAATSLIAIPLVALFAGGTAMASLTSAGSAAASGVASAGTALTGAGAKAARLAAGAAALPGGAKIKNKLVDAARKNVVGEDGQVVFTDKLVRYFAKDSSSGSTVRPVDLEADKHKRDKIQEVDVTGFELEKVLKCETGTAKVDKVLQKAFESLSLKEKRIKTQDNPVLRITGGPELEEREGKQVLVFYPLLVEQVVDVGVEPVPPNEVPPTLDESAFLRDARVVPTVKQAEVAVSKAPTRSQLVDKDEQTRDGTSETAAIPESAEDEIDSVVADAVSSVASDDEDVKAQQEHHERRESEEQAAPPPAATGKKSWFSWR